MKSVLISIQPKWCELIVLGKKTVEVRKTKPKIEMPFKCYIYETQGRTETPFVDEEGHHIFKGRGQVIGEFVCDEIYNGILSKSYFVDSINIEFVKTRVSIDEVAKYLGVYGVCGTYEFYGWHISDLVIYDEPRNLSEFYIYCGDNPKCDGCDAHYFSNTECGKEDYCCSIIDGCKPIKRPPQSWCYVMEGNR